MPSGGYERRVPARAILSYREPVSVVERAKTLATWEDLRDVPEGTKAEVVRGVLLTPPAPLPRHSSVQGKLRRFVGGAFDDATRDTACLTTGSLEL